MAPKKTYFLIPILALLYCHCVFAASQVHSLFSGFDFLDDNEAILSEKYWSSSKNVLYGKPVTEWTDEDFDELETELKHRIYYLYASDNPFRGNLISKFQKAIATIPNFRKWSTNSRLNPESVSDSDADNYMDKEIQVLPLLAALLILVFSAVLAWWYSRKKRSVLECPKCKTADKKMLSRGERAPNSTWLQAKCKYYCQACGYKWIQK